MKSVNYLILSILLVDRINEEDIDYLNELQKGIWKENTLGYIIEARKITQKELNRVFKIIKENKLPFKLHNSCMGFGIGLTVYTNPCYPGVASEHVLTINSNHLKIKRGSVDTRFERGWELFHPFAKKNEELSTEPLKSKSWYEY